MLGKDGKEHYGDVWPLTGHMWEGVCECGYKATVRTTAVNAARAVEGHLALVGLSGRRVEIHSLCENKRIMAAIEAGHVDAGSWK